MSKNKVNTLLSKILKHEYYFNDGSKSLSSYQINVYHLFGFTLRHEETLMVKTISSKSGVKDRYILYRKSPWSIVFSCGKAPREDISELGFDGKEGL